MLGYVCWKLLGQPSSGGLSVGQGSAALDAYLQEQRFAFGLA